MKKLKEQQQSGDDPFQDLMDAAKEDDQANPKPDSSSSPVDQMTSEPSDNDDKKDNSSDPYQSSIDNATKVSKDRGDIPEIIKGLKASVQQHGKVDPTFATKLVNGLIGTQDPKLVRVARRIQDYLSLKESKDKKQVTTAITKTNKKTISIDKALYERTIRTKATEIFLNQLKENLLGTETPSLSGDPLMPKVRRAILDAQTVVMDKLEEVIRKTLDLKDIGTMTAEHQRLYSETMKVFSEKVITAFEDALRSIQHLPQEQEEPKVQQQQTPPTSSPQK